MPGVDITKRITPDTMGKELTLKQQTELASKGMSPGIFKDIRFEDGVYKLKTKNEALANKKHPETGVPYSKKVVDLFGSKIEGVFPKFHAVFEPKTMPKSLWGAGGNKYSTQFDYCNEQLKSAIKNDPVLASQFSAIQLRQIEAGKTPAGYTWHHHQEPGRMQLVKTEDHDKTIGGAPHTGGNSIWGNKSIDNKTNNSLKGESF